MSERMWMVRAGEGARLIEEFVMHPIKQGQKKLVLGPAWSALG